LETGTARFHQKVILGVLGVVSDQDGRLLFVAQQKGPFGGHWLLPGGGVEPGESAEEAVVREVREETGRAMQNTRFLGVYEMRGEWAGGPYHITMLAFTGTAEGAIPEGFAGDGVGGVRWAHPHEIQLHSTDLRILTDAGAARFPDEMIDSALLSDGITLKVYRQQL
jgi:8-oxo-dGTP diphosphatase